MTTSVEVATAEAKAPEVQKRRRRQQEAQADDSKPRFFLAREGKSGREPVFDREFAGEAEVLVESLKTGRSFYVVYEYRAAADCSGKSPQIRKQAV